VLATNKATKYMDMERRRVEMLMKMMVEQRFPSPQM
jgi:hypothetical protein